MKNVTIAILILTTLIILFLSNPAKAGDTTTAIIRKVKTLIKKYDIKCGDIVLRQAIQETKWLKCNPGNCSMRYNNIFGMRSRLWVTESNPQGYKTYDSIEQSIVDYKRWQDKWYKGGDYYKFLVNKGYASDPKYINKLKSLKFNGI